MDSAPHRIYRVLGQTIRAEREKARLSQEALAEKAGVTRNYIGAVERAERSITLHALARIAKALKCRVRDLLRNA